MYLVGVDEVGRGALAGPVIASAITVQIQNLKLESIIYKENRTLKRLVDIGVKDSKELGSRKREELEPKIKEIVDGWAVGEAGVEEINSLGIIQATWLAMKRAIDALKTQIDLILIDGLKTKPLALVPQNSIIKGDKTVSLIAAASIVAKVYRDNLMSFYYHMQFSNYDFPRHKGYGTVLHRQRIKQYGISPVHRSLFCRRIVESDLLVNLD